MQLSDLPEGVKPIAPAKEREIEREWGPFAPQPPTGEGDIRMAKTLRILDPYVVQALIGDKWRTLIHGRRQGVRGQVHWSWSEAVRRVTELRKHAHPAEYAAGLQRSVGRMADLHKQMGERWAAEVEAQQRWQVEGRPPASDEHDEEGQ